MKLSTNFVAIFLSILGFFPTNFQNNINDILNDDTKASLLEKDCQPLHPYMSANIFSKLSFSFMNHILKIGNFYFNTTILLF